MKITLSCLKCRGAFHSAKRSTQSTHLLKPPLRKLSVSLRCLLNKYDFPCKIMRSGEKTMVYSFLFVVFILIYRMFVCVSRKAFLLCETKLRQITRDRKTAYLSTVAEVQFFPTRYDIFKMFHKKSFKTIFISESKDHN